MISADVTRILEMVATSDSSAFDVEELDAAILTAGRVLASINGKDCGLKRGLLAVALRAIETALLSDNVIAGYSKFWESTLGTARTGVPQRLEQLLGGKPPDSLVVHVLRCIASPVARNGRGKRQYSTSMDTLLRRAIENHPQRHLRCEYCGYHFRQDDLSLDRNQEAREAGAVLARELHPLRQVDSLKPPVFPPKGTPATGLTVDHVVPEFGLGWADNDNLVLACQFCNGGKLIYRGALEPVSVSVAASLSRFIDGDLHSLARQVIIVSAIRSALRTCSRCGRNADEVELSALDSSDDGSNHHWFVPWNLDVVCYDCFPERSP